MKKKKVLRTTSSGGENAPGRKKSNCCEHCTIIQFPVVPCPLPHYPSLVNDGSQYCGRCGAKYWGWHTCNTTPSFPFTYYTSDGPASGGISPTGGGPAGV